MELARITTSITARGDVPSPGPLVPSDHATRRGGMSGQHAPADGRRESGCYEIRLRGHLDGRWAAWFEGLSLAHASDGTTVIRGPVEDQAALHGLLGKVRDLGLPLVSVTRVGPDQADVLTNSRKEHER